MNKYVVSFILGIYGLVNAVSIGFLFTLTALIELLLINLALTAMLGIGFAAAFEDDKDGKPQVKEVTP